MSQVSKKKGGVLVKLCRVGWEGSMDYNEAFFVLILGGLVVSQIYFVIKVAEVDQSSVGGNLMD